MQYSTISITLCVTRGGRLLPWLGPALRGLVAHPMKVEHCGHSPQERETRWKYCTGCPHLSNCSYGQLFEPDPPPNATLTPGREDAIRPLILFPYFPLPEHAPVDLRIPVQILGIGAKAQEHLEKLLSTLSRIGPNQGMGADEVCFEVLRGSPEETQSASLSISELPLNPHAVAGVLPRVGVGLTAPLFLKSKDKAKRSRAILVPTFADLFRASLRTLGELFRHYDQPIPADFAALKAASQEVSLIDHCFEPFEQSRWSNRGQSRYQLRGVVGGGVYRNVPLSLLPWLYFGGRFHVGSHRVAGAGGWRIILD